MTIENIYTLYLQFPIVCTDTRNIEKFSIFFALKGPNFNANKFAEDALAKGSSYAIIDDGLYKKDHRYILVDDVLVTLQQLAKYHRQQMNIPVIAIVGSNGKTTTKEVLTSILMQQFKVLATPGNFNNHIGLPLTLLQLKKEHEVAVIEMGANHIGENAELCEIACPNLGLITNNGKDHLEGFGSIEGVIQSNSELYDYFESNGGMAFVNANDELLMRLSDPLVAKITYAANDDLKNAHADCVGIALELRPELKFVFNYFGETCNFQITSCLSGDYNFDNIIASVCIANHLGVIEENIIKGVESYRPTNNRSQVIKKSNNTIYLDAYNANPSSMEASLKNFAAMPFKGKIAIIGDMFEMGNYAEQEHKNMIDFCANLDVEKVWLIGEEFSKQLAPTMLQFNTTEEAIAYLKLNPLKEKNIFMKGSRGMKLEILTNIIS